MKILLLKPDELILKSKVTRRRFESILYKNIRDALKENEISVTSLKQNQTRYILKSSNLKKSSRILKEVAGLSYISIAEEVSLAKIDETALRISKLNSRKTFGIRAKSINKNYSSREVENTVGKFIQDKTRAKVNLTRPDTWVFIEILKDKAYIYTKKIEGRRGLPVGVSGRVIAIISKKEDLEAAKMIESRGAEIIEFKTKLPLKQAIKKAEVLALEHRAKAIVLGLKKLPSDIPKSKLLVFMPLIGLDKKSF